MPKQWFIPEDHQIAQKAPPLGRWCREAISPPELYWWRHLSWGLTEHETQNWPQLSSWGLAFVLGLMLEVPREDAFPQNLFTPLAHELWKDQG